MMLTLHDPQRAKHYYETGVWQNDTLYTLLRRHARVHDRLADAMSRGESVAACIGEIEAALAGSNDI